MSKRRNTLEYGLTYELHVQIQFTCQRKRYDDHWFGKIQLCRRNFREKKAPKFSGFVSNQFPCTANKSNNVQQSCDNLVCTYLNADNNFILIPVTIFLFTDTIRIFIPEIHSP